MKSHLKNEAPKPSSIIYATLEHAISGNIFLKNGRIFFIPLKRTLNSMLVLLNIDRDLLHETNIYVSKNATAKVKFGFENSYRLKNYKI